MRQLEYFVAVAQHGGTQQAARVLSVSQPSISHAIGELEAHWGVRLFVRQHARGMHLTAEGDARYRLSLRLLNDAKELMSGPGEDLCGELAIGCFDTLGPMYFPALMRIFQQTYPQASLRTREGDTEELLACVENGTLELALIYDTGIFSRTIRLHEVSEQRPYVLLPAGHRLARKASLAVSDLESEPFVLISPPRSRAYFLSIFSHAGVAPQIVAEAATIEMVRSLVANGHGVSILVTRPSKDFSYDGKAIVCKPLVGPIPAQKIVLAGAADHPLSPMAQAFLDIALKHFGPAPG